MQHEREARPIEMVPEFFTGVTRESTCMNCGKKFTQRELSPRVKKWISAFDEQLQDAWKFAVPDNFLPLFCVPCERITIGNQAQKPVERSSNFSWRLR